MTEPIAEGRDSYYLIDTNAQYSSPKPSPLDNLLKLYGLEPIAKSLERTKPDGSKGVKLRKSYKNHIQDLPGKHQIPPAKPVPAALLDPNLSQQPDLIRELDAEMLGNALKFEKTPVSGIPGFNTADLAISDQSTLMRGDDMSENEENRRKRKKQAAHHDVKRQHV
ncbi:hypothetical protein CJI97_005467 [Candidozyma auris]|uniref:Mediator of RNA polymerase II transcription subunit 19 n=2 Tax=Candidozyma auris TaxID=498019 RepID=A0A2H0ZEH9_CANAR|nr:hypothetical_protein [[Candida] auris]PIS48682.1 hypothetical protein B9J08_005384 [[Candida] auris]PIS49294.1 hypothetical protein CJI97_005467 [[Candida] auris]QEO23271.1 hypothetical_protein [[Candida] auris]QWW24573.1 hypothetical protein CA7LBN_003430 [[Candida] auris]GBL49317.1 hypothetical protein CAJCM15448_15910 [[Candida] auris]